VRHREDHVGGRPLLADHPVHDEPQGESLRILDLVDGNERRPEKVEGLAALALVPLTAALELELPLRHVVRHRVSGNVADRLLGGGGVPHLRPDHDPQLDLPVGLRRTPRDAHLVVGTHEGHRILQEHDGFRGEVGPRLGRVVAVVEADADDLPGSCDRGAHPEAHRIRKLCQGSDPLGLADEGGTPAGEERPVEVVGDAAQVEDRASGVQHGDLRAPLPQSSQSHTCSPSVSSTAFHSPSASP
jgi:hypothetical protein